METLRSKLKRCSSAGSLICLQRLQSHVVHNLVQWHWLVLSVSSVNSDCSVRVALCGHPTNLFGSCLLFVGTRREHQLIFSFGMLWLFLWEILQRCLSIIIIQESCLTVFSQMLRLSSNWNLCDRRVTHRKKPANIRLDEVKTKFCRGRCLMLQWVLFTVGRNPNLGRCVAIKYGHRRHKPAANGSTGKPS